MKKIYKGNIRKLVVKELEINGDKVKILKYDKPVIKKDLMFYTGIVGSYISFEHGTRLADEFEALDYVKDAIEKRENKEAPYPEMIFANNDDIKFSHEICNSNFRAVKKFYRDLRREERREEKRRSR